MKFNYYKETNSMYINLKDVPGVDSCELSPNIVADYDTDGNIIGIEILDVKDKITKDLIIFQKI